MYYARSGLARFLYRRLTAMKVKSEEKGTPNLNILFIYNMPFRALAKMTAGMISMEMVDGILLIVNILMENFVQKIVFLFLEVSKLSIVIIVILQYSLEILWILMLFGIVIMLMKL